MAVAAYASVLSLLRVIDNAQHPSRLRLFPDATQIDSLREKICFLQDFFELHSSTITEDAESIARKIPRVALEADILIDNYVVDQLYNDSQDPQNHDVLESFIKSFQDEMHRVMQQIESIIEALTALRTGQQKPPTKNKVDKFTCDEPLKDTVVGFDDQLKQVLEKLTGNKKDLVIVPIVGMGGIGKTTLARSIFDHPYSLDNFHVRIWLTISQDYSVERVLQELLNVLGETGDGSESVLITKLHQKLFGQRYLVVLDDVWSLEAWHDLRRGLPNNGNASRVMVTTRLSDIACSLDCSGDVSHSMKFLDEDASWDLFSQRAFERAGRSHELEGIGREISKRCKGLPLLLVVVGGLLASSNMSVEHWRTVAEDINSFANSAADEYCLRVLSLSYHHLPIHLKPCFLCMRHCDEDEKVLAVGLILYWVAEGFVKPVRGKSLEECARAYLEDLVGRNMLLVRERTILGNIKTCGIHDLLRDFCIKQYERERLLEVRRCLPVGNIDGVCFLCQAERTDLDILRSEVLGPDSKYDGKMLVCRSCEGTFPELIPRSRFVAAVRIRNGSQDVRPLMTKCRFLYATYSFEILDTVHLLWNLEVLVMRGPHECSSSIPWKMPQLRYLRIYDGFMLPDPAANDVAVLENLQTISTIEQFKCTEEIARRIPNLRKLGVRYDGESFEEKDWPCFHLRNLALLEKLESLKMKCRFLSMDVNAISFPQSLRELTLKGCRIAKWDDLTVVGSLPNLQVLKLKEDSVLGEEWNPDEGEFLRLKYLRLEDLGIVHWRLSEDHFPALETVVLKDMRNLEAIPREIGELPALCSIYLLGWCRWVVVDSAKVIVNEQQLDYGNEKLLLHVEDSYECQYLPDWWEYITYLWDYITDLCCIPFLFCSSS